MRSTWTHDLTSRYTQIVEDIHSAAISFKSSHLTILDDRDRRILSQPTFKRMPYHARRYVLGYWAARARTHELTQLEWRMMWRGNLVTDASILPGTYNEIVSEQSRHVYKSDPTRAY